MKRARRSKSRLARLAATALAIPALIFSAAAPAQAANAGSPAVVVTAPSTAAPFERATITVKVTENGAPLANQPVTVSLDSTSVAVLGNVSKSATAKTDSSGTLTMKNFLYIKSLRTGTVTINVTSGTSTGTTRVEVVPSTGTLAWDKPQLTVEPNTTHSVRVASVLLSGANNPTRLNFSYTGDVTGPATGLLNSGRAVVLTGVKVGPNGGTITATSATGGFGSAVMTVATR